MQAANEQKAVYQQLGDRHKEVVRREHVLEGLDSLGDQKTLVLKTCLL